MCPFSCTSWYRLRGISLGKLCYEENVLGSAGEEVCLPFVFWDGLQLPHNPFGTHCCFSRGLSRVGGCSRALGTFCPTLTLPPQVGGEDQHAALQVHQLLAVGCGQGVRGE